MLAPTSEASANGDPSAAPEPAAVTTISDDVRRHIATLRSPDASPADCLVACGVLAGAVQEEAEARAICDAGGVDAMLDASSRLEDDDAFLIEASRALAAIAQVGGAAVGCGGWESV